MRTCFNKQRRQLLTGVWSCGQAGELQAVESVTTGESEILVIAVVHELQVARVLEFAWAVTTVAELVIDGAEDVAACVFTGLLAGVSSEA